jgi:hypothetical protein
MAVIEDMVVFLVELWITIHMFISGVITKALLRTKHRAVPIETARLHSAISFAGVTCGAKQYDVTNAVKWIMADSSVSFSRLRLYLSKCGLRASEMATLTIIFACEEKIPAAPTFYVSKLQIQDPEILDLDLLNAHRVAI